MSWESEFRVILAGDLLAAARALLGVHLVCGSMRARIVETEAYGDDPGSHAHRGVTPRTKVMFDRPGLAYVYFTYGAHWMLNVTAQPEGNPGAILIRAAEPIAGLEEMRLRRLKAKSSVELLNGPGKLAQAFEIDGSFYGVDLLNRDSILRLEEGSKVGKVQNGNRIGLARGKGDGLPWRFFDADSLKFVSRSTDGPSR